MASLFLLCKIQVTIVRIEYINICKVAWTSVWHVLCTQQIEINTGFWNFFLITVHYVTLFPPCSKCCFTLSASGSQCDTDCMFQPSVLDFDRYCWCCTTAILSLSSCLLVRVSPLCVALCSVMWTLLPKCEANCSEPVTHGLTPLKSS